MMNDTFLSEPINRQIEYAKKNSRFYSYLPEHPVLSSEEFRTIPEISCKDLLVHGAEMLCVSPSRIRRLVDLTTSGTTGIPKRMYFTDSDLDATVRFFCKGMNALMNSDETAVVFMPDGHPDGMTDLLSRGIISFGGRTIVYGAIHDYNDAAELVRHYDPSILVGFPVQMRRLLLTHPEIHPKRVLISADYCADSLIRSVERSTCVEVYTHYGMTETCYGGAVETPARAGMISREDLYIELNPKNEVLITTMGREAIPLIRYNTGDLGVMNDAGNLTKILGRRSDLAQPVSITELDELLFEGNEIIDYTALFHDNELSVVVMGDDDLCRRRLRQRYSDFKIAVRQTEDIPFTGKRTL